MCNILHIKTHHYLITKACIIQSFLIHPVYKKSFLDFFFLRVIQSRSHRKNFKSLDAYNYFISGWVQEIKHVKLPGVVVLKCGVRPSYHTTEEPHHSWVALKTNGSVIVGHCFCMAG